MTRFLIYIFLAFPICGLSVSASPIIVNGVLDARSHHFSSEGSLTLTGDWLFQPGEFVAPNKPLANAQSTAVPGGWKNTIHFGTYRLLVLLPKTHRKLAIKTGDIATAFNLYANDQLVLSGGKTSRKTRGTNARYIHVIQPIEASDSLWITIQVSNQQNFEGGILGNLQLGEESVLSRDTNSSSMLGFLITGAMLFCGFFHIGFGFFRKKNFYHFYYAGTCFLMSLHFLCMNERWLYSFLGEGNWALALQIELISIIASLFLMQKTAEIFLDVRPSRVFNWISGIFWFGQIVGIVVIPISVVSGMVNVIPYDAIAVAGYITLISAIALRRKKEGSLAILVCTAIMFVVVLSDVLFVHQHVGGLIASHYGLFFYALYLTFVLSRQTAFAFKQARFYSEQLKIANAALEVQNENLESLVSRRTQQLLETEQRAHALELEFKQRDLESVSANNQVKHEITKSLVHSLEKLQGEDQQIKLSLKLLVSDLKQQLGMNERLNTLESESEKVNAEFHQRLVEKYPGLTKTERELCTLIKLNLSNKEIAALLKSSTNATNVARSRLRKKLNLSREIDLEVFIRQL